MNDGGEVGAPGPGQGPKVWNRRDGDEVWGEVGVGEKVHLRPAKSQSAAVCSS